MNATTEASQPVGVKFAYQPSSGRLWIAYKRADGTQDPSVVLGGDQIVELLALLARHGHVMRTPPAVVRGIAPARKPTGSYEVVREVAEIERWRVFDPDGKPEPTIEAQADEMAAYTFAIALNRARIYGINEAGRAIAATANASHA